jgi:hypothetical protein
MVIGQPDMFWRSGATLRTRAPGSLAREETRVVEANADPQLGRRAIRRILDEDDDQESVGLPDGNGRPPRLRTLSRSRRGEHDDGVKRRSTKSSSVVTNARALELVGSTDDLHARVTEVEALAFAAEQNLSSLPFVDDPGRRRELGRLGHYVRSTATAAREALEASRRLTTTVITPKRARGRRG